jgi:predicted nucleotidyltransferase
MPPANHAKIREIADRVVAALSPERVVLFGSYAWGQPDADSDVDLYVIVADCGEPAYRLARRAYHALRGVRVPVDLVVRTRAESERNAVVVSTLDHLALTRGLQLHG